MVSLNEHKKFLQACLRYHVQVTPQLIRYIFNVFVDHCPVDIPNLDDFIKELTKE